jgi:hypothetical protein
MANGDGPIVRKRGGLGAGISWPWCGDIGTVPTMTAKIDCAAIARA